MFYILPGNEKTWPIAPKTKNKLMLFDNKNISWKIVVTVVALLVAVGCSKQSDGAASEESDSDASPVASKQMTREIDEMCEEILQSPDKMEAADWIKRFPESSIGTDEDGNEILLAPVVARLTEAGAERVAIEYVKLGQGEFLVSMVVALPKDTASRQKLFAMEPELSLLCQQTPTPDHGQKYLHYSFD